MTSVTLDIMLYLSSIIIDLNLIINYMDSNKHLVSEKDYETIKEIRDTLVSIYSKYLSSVSIF